MPVTNSIDDTKKLVSSHSMMGLVSIIIPVYNAAPYLEMLINSVYAQTYTNFEVIIAYEEASTDASWEVLRRLQEQFNFILTTGSERCPGGTRNRGLESAKGEFVVFVDADDYLMPDYLSSMVSVFSQYPELSVVSCNYLRVSNAEDLPSAIAKATKSKSKIEVYDTAVMTQMLLSGKRRVMPWLWMVRRDYLTQYNLKFPLEYYGEDNFFAYSIVSHTPSIGLSTKKVYLYVERASSIMGRQGDKWLDSTNCAYYKIPQILLSIDNSYAEDYRYFLKTFDIYQCSNLMNYADYLSYIKINKISRLPYCRYNRPIYTNTTALLFNISPALLYYASRIYNVISHLRGTRKW